MLPPGEQKSAALLVLLYGHCSRRWNFVQGFLEVLRALFPPLLRRLGKPTNGIVRHPICDEANLRC